jgi:hypothetical protein
VIEGDFEEEEEDLDVFSDEDDEGSISYSEDETI